MDSRTDKKDWTPASVIVGSIIIALSILFTGGKLGGGTTTNPNTQTQPQTVVKVTDRADSPRMGSGKVEIVVFSDFQCPFCQQFFNTAYKDIKKNYVDTGKAKFIFRHFPLTAIHVNAMIAGEAAECANLQGRFFEYHDVLFVKAKSDGTNLDKNSLKQYAKDLGLDTQKFNACLDNGETEAAVKKDLADGQAAGVTATPTIFVNGVKIVGAQPYAAFSSVIDSELKK